MKQKWLNKSFVFKVMNMPLFYEKKQLVTPGDFLAEGNYIAGENTYKDDDKIYASRVGLVDYDARKIHVVALKAFYVPSVGDTVIGKIVEVGTGGWAVDINAPYLAMLRAADVLDRPFGFRTSDLPSIFDVGDLLITKIIAYDRTRDPLLTVREPGLGKIMRGQLVKVTPTKIPRVIGRKGSMISMIKKETTCQITIGQNGLILINGKTPEDERLAVMALHKIEEESHTSGLTDHVTEMLKKKKEGVEHA
ncbi:MAG: Exosome complex component Rrp4 [Candidatus Bathyarchaeota archaeon BA2]|nr:MAG: Exosome complex component Rrp4 [Candidatus Bathyarchaeota archaeon BA2]